MAFYVDGAERACRTQVLTGSTSDALLGVYCRNLERFGIRRVGRNHQNSSCGAMACTVSTCLFVGERDATFFHPYGMAYLDGRLFGFIYQVNGTCRTDFRTFRAFGAAITAFVRCGRLHERVKRRRRTEHFVGADRYAKLASGAMLLHITCALRTRRSNRSLAFRCLLVDDVSKPAVQFDDFGFLYSLCLGCGGKEQQRPCQYLTPSLILGLRSRL